MAPMRAPGRYRWSECLPSVTMTAGSSARSCAVEVRRAGADLVRLGVAVRRRAALHDVRDEHVLALPADGAEQLREQLARRPDERAAGAVLARAGALADEEHVAQDVPLAGDGVRATGRERAAGAAANRLRDSRQRRPASVRLARGAHRRRGYRAAAAPRRCDRSMSCRSSRHRPWPCAAPSPRGGSG